MTYRIEHLTTYRYDDPVSSSYGTVHLLPRETSTQECYSASLSIEPYPEDYRERRDYFGNRAAHFHVREPHKELLVMARSVVDVRSRPTAHGATGSQPWDAAREQLMSEPAPEHYEARQFLLASPAVPLLPDAAAFASSSFTPGRPLLDAVADLAHRIHDDFEYSPGATTVTTTVEQVLEQRAGVCQDFAHLALAGLRSHGLAARYVSGYLETEPPPGQAKLQGADMSHAWVSVYVPGNGWMDIDPTNDQFANDRYVTLAWGRDYSDVPPLKGVIFTEAKTTELTVTVDVVRVADDDPSVIGA